MLDLQRVASALAAKRDLFASYEGDRRSTLDAYLAEWCQVATLPRAEIEARLAGIERPGARPSLEHDRYRRPIVPFGQVWHNHEEARAWAEPVLRGVTTIAVDGSQISPSKDFSLPVGAVQIGWFENPHDPARDYVKDVSFQVLAPQELAGEDEGDGTIFPDWQVNWRRFQGECALLASCMRAHAADVVKPVCFFDGSLILSFVQHMGQAEQGQYLGAVTELLSASESTRVPLVGYVDTSYAADLVATLDALAGRPRQGRASDAAFLRPCMRWGDRTPAWICARQDAVLPVDGASYYDRVAFVYLKTTRENAPARLDLPRWLVEEGELERVIDIVRAEDRERFYAAFQRFAAQESLPLRYSRKAGSKVGRR